MRTLSEAIKHCVEVADAQESKASSLGEDDVSKIADCVCCAREHRQLAAWLEELEYRRRVMSEEVVV